MWNHNKSSLLYKITDEFLSNTFLLTGKSSTLRKRKRSSNPGRSVLFIVLLKRFQIPKNSKWFLSLRKEYHTRMIKKSYSRKCRRISFTSDKWLTRRRRRLTYFEFRKYIWLNSSIYSQRRVKTFPRPKTVPEKQC